MSRKKLIILYPILICAVLAAIILPLSSSSKDKPLPDTMKTTAGVSLNESIDNVMSDIPELEKMDSRIENFLKKWEIKGASLSIMRNDSLLYAKGYGYADEALGEKMSPGHILRMASVSKLITAAGIMVLQEKGKLSLRDTVFGERGILSDSIYTSAIREKADLKDGFAPVDPEKTRTQEAKGGDD